MKTRLALMLAITGGAATIAAAQPQTQGTATWNLQYFVATQGTSGWANGTAAGVPGGTVGPGQAALFRLSFSLSGTPGGVVGGVPVGSPLTWDPSILTGSSGAGGLGGLWAGNVDIVGSGGDVNGPWSENSAAFSADLRRRLISPYGAGGNPAAGSVLTGRVNNIQPAQFGPTAGLLDHGNNLVVWTGMWIPDSYNARTVNFNAVLGSLGLMTQVYAIDATYEFGFELPVALRVQTNFGNGVSVPIVPAPSSLALLGLGGLVALRRRR